MLRKSEPLNEKTLRLVDAAVEKERGVCDRIYPHLCKWARGDEDSSALSKALLDSSLAPMPEIPQHERPGFAVGYQHIFRSCLIDGLLTASGKYPDYPNLSYAQLMAAFVKKSDAHSSFGINQTTHPSYQELIDNTPSDEAAFKKGFLAGVKTAEQHTYNLGKRIASSVELEILIENQEGKSRSTGPRLAPLPPQAHSSPQNTKPGRNQGGQSPV